MHDVLLQALQLRLHLDDLLLLVTNNVDAALDLHLHLLLQILVVSVHSNNLCFDVHNRLLQLLISLLQLLIPLHVPLNLFSLLLTLGV